MHNNQNAQGDAHAPREVRLEDLTPDMALPHNVFADLGLPNAEMRQAKALVSILFEKALKVQGLTQRQAAQKTGLTQPEVSKIVRGVCSGFTLDRMLSAMAALGHDVEIILRATPPEQQHGAVRVARQPTAVTASAPPPAPEEGVVEIVGLDGLGIGGGRRRKQVAARAHDKVTTTVVV